MSSEQKTPIISDSIIKIAIKKSFSLYLIVEITEITHRGVIKAVSTTNRIEIPSIPTL